MKWPLFATACSVCQQISQDENSICADCEQLLEQLCETTNADLAVFSHRWQAFKCLGVYSDLLATVLNRGKFKADYSALMQLARLFCKKHQACVYAPGGVVVPVPMMYRRYIRRGFNQAELLARTMANILALKYEPTLVKHSGTARVQHHLGRSERQRNMHDAFLCHRPAPRYVYLVDDIYTTGATMNAMCDCLKASGAEYIEAWVIARTL
jgi:ComF family protein